MFLEQNSHQQHEISCVSTENIFHSAWDWWSFNKKNANQSHHLHTQQLQICHLPIWTNATGRDGVNLVTVVEALNSHAPVYKWRGQSCLHKQLIQSALLVWWFCGQFALWTCIANAQALRNALIVFKRMPTCNAVQSDCHAWRLDKCMGPMHGSCKGIDILSRMCKEGLEIKNVTSACLLSGMCTCHIMIWTYTANRPSRCASTELSNWMIQRATSWTEHTLQIGQANVRAPIQATEMIQRASWWSEHTLQIGQVDAYAADVHWAK